MVDLSVKFGGIEFKNPVSIASLSPCAPWGHWPPEKDAPEIQMKMWRKYYENGVGSIVTGTIYHEDLPGAHGVNRFYPITTRGFAVREGLLSRTNYPQTPMSRTNSMESIRRAKKEFTDVRIIASLRTPGVDTADWANMVLEAQQAGADMIELNFGNLWGTNTAKTKVNVIEQGMSELREKIPKTGISLGLVPEMASKIVAGIKARTSIPLIIKITPELGFYRLLAAMELYREAGAAGLTCDHSFYSTIPPDIYRGGEPKNSTVNTWVGTQGPWTRFACYRDVPAVTKYGNGLDVQACGGLVIPEHCIEIMMLGAKTVQLSSGLFWNGINFSGRVLNFMRKYMEEQGYNSVNDFIGLGLRYFVEMEKSREELTAQVGKVVAQIDYDKCKESCDVCRDNWCFATTIEGDRVGVDIELCSGCNLCVIRCPHGARSMRRIGEEWTSGQKARDTAV